MTFRFLGTELRIGEMPAIQSFGQSVELPEPLARNIIAPDGNAGRGAALLPEETFSAIGFTADELAAHKWTSSHADAPTAFQEKKSAALAALNELRQRLASGGPFILAKTKKGGE